MSQPQTRLQSFPIHKVAEVREAKSQRCKVQGRIKPLCIEELLVVIMLFGLLRKEQVVVDCVHIIISLSCVFQYIL